MALCQHFSENITRHCSDSYKNTSAQRNNSGFDSVFIHDKQYSLNHILLTAIKIWYKIICVSSTIHANILHSQNAKIRTVKTIFFFWGVIKFLATNMQCSCNCCCYLRQPQGGTKHVQVLCADHCWRLN